MIHEYQAPSGLSFLDIKTQHCSATLCLNGGQLTSWIPLGQEEVLFVSSRAGYLPGKPIRGGIPICWPWFGKKEGKPVAHGYARNSLWTLESCLEGEGEVVIVLFLNGETGRDASARMTLHLGLELQMVLETKAGTQPCVLTEALHTYFRVGDVSKCEIFGLEKVPFVEFARGTKLEGASSSKIVPCGEIDRVYSLPDHEGVVHVHDVGMKRSIDIWREESASIIVWNPWKEGAKEISDLGCDEWMHFLCVEIGNDFPSQILLPPGGVHQLRQNISLKSIE